MRVSCRDTDDIDNVDLNRYKLLYIPSNTVNTPGGITSTLNRALIRNKAKITNFVNVRGESFEMRRVATTPLSRLPLCDYPYPVDNSLQVLYGILLIRRPQASNTSLPSPSRMHPLASPAPPSPPPPFPFPPALPFLPGPLLLPLPFPRSWLHGGSNTGGIWQRVVWLPARAAHIHSPGLPG